jgi:VanZ family protein
VTARVLARGATAVFAVVLVAIVVAADSDTLPLLLQRVYTYPGGDKIGHVTLFGGLAFLAALGFTRRTSLAGVRIPASTLVVAVLVTLEEASQAWFPGRTASLWDLLASYVGIAGGTIAASRVRDAYRRTRAAGRAGILATHPMDEASPGVECRDQ